MLPARRRLAVFSAAVLAVLAAVLAIVLPGGNASAAGHPAAGNRVWAISLAAQRLLEPLAVVNPHARELGFADGTVRTRRDHVKYLTLIAAITLLHQHQRLVKTAARGEAVIRRAGRFRPGR